MSDLRAVELFAGVGGFGLGLERSGIPVKVAVEIDPACRGVYTRHFPDAIMLNDVTEVTGDQLRALGVVPNRCVLTFGWPCQDLSVAGRREGLGGARSGLFWQAMRLAAELRPRWIVAENVDGLLSAVCTCPGDHTCMANGRAVSCGRWEKRAGRRQFVPHVLHGVPGGVCPGGCMRVHGGAMGTVLGAVAELGYGFAYRVLDAQGFGVAQRRHRVFIVGCFGDWAAPVAVLLEPEGSAGGAAAGASAGTRVAGTVAASTGRCGGESGDSITSWLVEVAGTVRSHPRPGSNSTGAVVAAPLAFDAYNGAVDGDATYTLDTKDRCARGVIAPAVTRSFGNSHTGNVLDAAALAVMEATQVAATLQGGGRRGHRVDAEGAAGGHLVAHALTSEGADASEDGTGRGTPLVCVPRPVPMAFDAKTGGSEPRIGYGPVVNAVPAQQRAAVHSGMVVRRLTPLETERLQGFPDGWTEFTADGKRQSDSARYRQVGNAVCAAVSTWVARRLVAVERGEL